MSRIGGKYIQSHKESWSVGASLVVTHNFNTLDVMVVAREIDTGKILTLPTGWGSYDVGVTVTSANVVTLDAAAAPTGSGIRVTVIPL
jgi:hypothetical protein